MSRKRNERGAALIETAITLPIILLISVGIFEFGRAFQTWQVLTNAAREGARQSVIGSATVADVQTTVRTYMRNGGLSLADSDTVTINVQQTVAVGTAQASSVTISYPFSFMMLNPIIKMVTPGSTTGAAPLTMSSVATMRNE